MYSSVELLSVCYIHRMLPICESLSEANEIFKMYSVEFCFLTNHTHTKNVDLWASGFMSGWMLPLLESMPLGSTFVYFQTSCSIKIRNYAIQFTRFGKYHQGKIGFIFLFICLSSSLHEIFGQINSN